MNTHKSTVAAITLSLLALFSTTVFAQAETPRPQIAPSYELTLQVVVGSNDAGQGTGLPAELRAVAAQIKTSFGFTNYRLDNTFLGRVGTSGSFEYKSVSNTMGTGVDSDTPTFLEWTLGGLRTSTNDKGRMIFQAEPFRFGARVPVRIATPVGDTGRIASNVAYEAVGVTVNRVSLSENTPTLIGTLSLPKTAGTIFLVLTIKPTE